MSVTTRGRRHQHSPRVRRLAAEAGLPLTALVGTGPAGRVTPDDIGRAARVVERELDASPTPAPAPGALTSVVEVDVTALVALCERDVAIRTEDSAGRLTMTACFAKAAVEALPTHHRLGIGLDTGDGVLVGVIDDARDLTVLGLARRIADITEAARSGSLTTDDRTSATVSLLDASSRGVLWDTPTLKPGLVAALSAGVILERPAVVRRSDGERVIAVRSMTHLAMTYDRRTGGDAAARLLTTMKDRLEAGRYELT